MDCFFDIKALPDPEIIESAVVAYLMQQLHTELPAFGGRIGIDFPAYGRERTLGGIVRAVGIRADIEELHNRLKNNPTFTDYALLTSTMDVPGQIGKHAKYRRYHVKGNSHYKRLKKRHELRNTWSSELATVVADKFSAISTLPHLKLNSSSTGQNFILFIKQQVQSKPGTGSFNGYGLSLGEATVPKF